MIAAIGSVLSAYRGVPDGMRFNINGSSGEIYAAMDMPTEKEINDFQNGAVQLKAGLVNGIIFLFAKCGGQSWSDMPYNPHLSRDIIEMHQLDLVITLVNTRDGKIMAMRSMLLDSSFTAEFFSLVKNFNKMSDKMYLMKISMAFSYPTERLMKEAHGLISAVVEPSSQNGQSTASIRKSLQDIQHGVVRGKNYPGLPKEYLPFYCYIVGSGHCLCTVIESLIKPGRELDNYEVPLPVKYLLSIEHRIEDGYLIADVPYNGEFGVEIDGLEEYEEYDPV